MRQEFERHRYVNQIQVVDTLLFQSHAEYQVRGLYLSILWTGQGHGGEWQTDTGEKLWDLGCESRRRLDGGLGGLLPEFGVIWEHG